MFYARNTKTQKYCMALMQQCEGRTFIIFDTETTGIDIDKDYIVELAAMKFQLENGEPKQVDKINLYIRPPFLMDDKVVNIHKITNEFLKDKPAEEDVFPEIKAFFGENPILLGYNVDFDVNILNSLYRRNGESLTYEVVIDIMDMGYDLLTEKDLPDHKLGTLTEYLGLDVGLEFHNALDDTLATYRLLLYFHKAYQKRPVVTNKHRIYVNAIYFWKGFRKEQSGIYLKTNLGLIYFSTFKKMWCSSQVDLSQVDIDEMETYVLNKTGLTLKEFGRLTEKKFATLKLECRERGVYL